MNENESTKGPSSNEGCVMTTSRKFRAQNLRKPAKESKPISVNNSIALKNESKRRQEEITGRIV